MRISIRKTIPPKQLYAVYLQATFLSIKTSLILEDVAREFENWRKTKVTGRRIPLELWQQVKKLPSHYRVSHITSMLRINTEQYRRYVRPDLHAITRKLAPTPSNDFIKVENLLSIGASVKPYRYPHLLPVVTLKAFYATAKSLICCIPCQIVFAPGSPSLFLLIKPPNLAIITIISCNLGGVFGSDRLYVTV